MNTVPLGDVCKIVNGGTPKSGVGAYWDGGVAWLTPAQMGKMSGPHIAETDRTISETGLKNSSAKLVPPSSVILSTRAPIGHLAINDVPMAFNQGCRGLVPGSRIDTSYLYYFLFHSREALNALGTGTTFKELSASRLRDFHIPAPPISEQRQIVTILEEALADIGAATANAEKNFANVRELLETTSNEMLTSFRGESNVTRLDDVCEISSKLIDPRREEYNGLLHVGAGNMETRTGQLSSLLTAGEEGLISGKFLFDSSMVLYSKIRPYLRKVCRPDFSGLCSADVYPLIPKAGKLNRDFLFHLLLSRDFTTYAEAGSARAGMPKVNREHLFAYQLELPPVEEQQRIAKGIDAVAERCAELASVYRRRLKHLAALKQSLLDRAFSGEPLGTLLAA